jgi:hypothetical protein
MASNKHSQNRARGRKRGGRRNTHQPTPHQGGSTRRCIAQRKLLAAKAPDPTPMKEQMSERIHGLRAVMSAIVVSVAALRRQNCDIDEDIAHVLERSGAGRLDIEIERLGLLIQVPWGQHVRILDKTRTPAQRLFYLRATAAYGWTLVGEAEFFVDLLSPFPQGARCHRAEGWPFQTRARGQDGFLPQRAERPRSRVDDNRRRRAEELTSGYCRLRSQDGCGVATCGAGWVRPG